MNATELIQRMQPLLAGLLLRLGEEQRLATQNARKVARVSRCMDSREESDAERAAAR